MIQLRDFQLEDIDTLVEWIGRDPSILAGMRVPEDTTEFQVRAVAVQSIVDPTQAWFVAEKGGTPVGLVMGTEIKPNGSALCHIIISPDHRDGFTAVRVGKAAVAHAFNGMGLTTLLGIVAKDNEAALKLDKLLGFSDMNVSVLQLTKDEYLGGGTNGP